MGGWSPEKKISMMSGKNVVAGLRKAGVKATPVVLTNADKNAKRLEKRLKAGKFDLVFIALHGTFGEDGQLQALLDKWKIPYTGSGALACGLAMHKGCSKLVFEAQKLPTAPWVAVHRSTAPAAWGKGVKFPLPWVVKPADSGSAIGVTIVRDRKALPKAMRLAFRTSEWAVVERFVAGTEVTVAVLGPKALPVIEILPVNEFYDFDSKYTPGHSAHIIPARIPASLRTKAQALSLKAGKALGCEDYYRVDLIVPAKGEPQILEVNTAPGMTATSLVPDAARAAGMAFPALLKRICQMALKRGGK